jgi:tripartite-type tricarboxylate transporter receptor subunit TctC
MLQDRRGVLAMRGLIAGLTLCLSITSGIASDVNFEGKSVTIIIPSGVGGGTDAMGRLTGRLLGEYLPGKPIVIFQNMPGASGIKALNYFVTQVKPDGLTSISGSASNIDPTILRNPAVRYDSKALAMFGGFPAPNGVLILRKDAMDRFYGKSPKPAVMGDANGVRTSDQMAVWGPNYLGWNIRWVTGYPGTNEIVLAAMQGEVDLLATYDESIISQFDKTGEFVFPAQTGIVQDGKLVRSKGFADVPIFAEIVRPHLKSPQETRAFESWVALAQIGKWLALPPNTDADIVRTYRQASARLTENAEFKAEALKILGDDYTVATGEETERMTAVADSVSQDDLKFFDHLREKVGISGEGAN